MDKESNRNFSVYFTEEFNKCLDQIQSFFADQGVDVLEWWVTKEDNMINEIDHLLSSFPYVGKSQHRMLNYLIFYMVFEDEETIVVINILPSRSKRKRIR